MPCRYYTEAEEREIAYKELNLVTKLLCKAVSILRSAEIPLYGELAAWAEEHDKMDAAREKAEKDAKKRDREHKIARVKALGKLSPSEKKALGIYD